MTRIYKNFSEFRLENKSIFKFLSKSDHWGLFEAVWNARSAEIDVLKKKIEEQRAELEENKEKFKIQNEELGFLLGKENSSLEKFDQVKQELYRAQDEASLLRSKNQNLLKENETLTDSLRTLEEKEQVSRLRFENSTQLIVQLEGHIQRQKQTIDDLRGAQAKIHSEFDAAKKELVPLQFQIKELMAHAQMTDLDLEQYKAFHEQDKRTIVQQSEHIEKLKANSLVLKELAEKSKADLKTMSEELRHSYDVLDNLRTKIDFSSQEKMSFEKKISEQALFTEELKNGVRNMKQTISELQARLDKMVKENLDLKNTVETLTASEHFHKNELQKSKVELEKVRVEREKLSDELRRLNLSVRDVQSSLGNIHERYIRSRPSSLEN